MMSFNIQLTMLQAILLAKKKEKEMSVAEKMADIREEEVDKMRQKVQHMQVGGETNCSE